MTKLQKDEQLKTLVRKYLEHLNVYKNFEHQIEFRPYWQGQMMAKNNIVRIIVATLLINTTENV